VRFGVSGSGFGGLVFVVLDGFWSGRSPLRYSSPFVFALVLVVLVLLLALLLDTCRNGPPPPSSLHRRDFEHEHEHEHEQEHEKEEDEPKLRTLRLPNLLPMFAYGGALIVPVISPGRVTKMDDEVTVVRGHPIAKADLTNGLPVSNGLSLASGK
jgi:hypothetical protein